MNQLRKVLVAWPVGAVTRDDAVVRFYPVGTGTRDDAVVRFYVDS